MTPEFQKFLQQVITGIAIGGGIGTVIGIIICVWLFIVIRRDDKAHDKRVKRG